MEKTKKHKTFIRWPGNKSKYLKWIIPHLPSTFTTYIEPFLGSGALLLYLQPQTWIANDLNKDIVNAWMTVRSNPKYLLRKFKAVNEKLQSLNDTKEQTVFCKAKTAAIPGLGYGPNRASWFIAMIFCAFLGHIVQRNKFSFGSLDITL